MAVRTGNCIAAGDHDVDAGARRQVLRQAAVGGLTGLCHVDMRCKPLNNPGIEINKLLSMVDKLNI